MRDIPTASTENRRASRAAAACRFFISAVIALSLPVLAGQAQEEVDADAAAEVYPGAPPATVIARKDQLVFYPCSQCHAAMTTDTTVRELNVMHVAEIDHGQGRIWCMNCHASDDHDTLQTLLDEPVDFDASHLVCGGCHSARYRDWAFGAHGKRADDWQGDRTLYACTECHDAHRPAIQPRAPEPPPAVRSGLEREPGRIEKQLPGWRQSQEEQP